MDCLKINADGMPLSLIPLSVVSWQEAVRLIFTDKARVIKSYDDWTVRSQYFDMPVPSIIILTEQVKYSKTLKYNRNNVYLRDDFTCQLQITSRCRDAHGKGKYENLTLDHVIPKSLGGKTTWLNVCASCKECNSEKGDDASIVPKKKPTKPTYYELLAKRKTMPIHIRDEDWKYYVSWPEHLIKVVPHAGGDHPA